MYNPIEVQRIDRQIEDLQRMKVNFQNMGMGQPPINNIITTPQPTPQTQPVFEAKFTTENPSDILITNKTAFINLRDGKLSIKEVDGEVKEYFIILPKDEKDLKIENLENKLREMEMKFNDISKPVEPIIKKSEPNEYDNEYVAKSKSKNNFFRPNEQ